MERREFFGIIAAPLARRTGTPPVAICRNGVEQLNGLLSVQDIPRYNPKGYSMSFTMADLGLHPVEMMTTTADEHEAMLLESLRWLES